MTREEARRLLSGYATGSLTELEQQLLFDAALDDQELFDELADEQTVKELIEVPGAKRRLLFALGPERKQFTWWPWAAGIAVAAMIAVGVWLARPGPEPKETALVARVEAPAVVTTAPVPQVAPSESKASTALETKKTEIATDAETAPAAKTLALADRANAVTATETAPVPAQAEARARQELPTVTPPVRSAPARQAFLAPPPPAAPVAAPAIASGGALTYEVRITGILRMTPSREGVLEVTFDGRPLYPSQPVAAGRTIDVSIPLEAKQLRIDYAAEADAPPVVAQTGDVSGTLVLPVGPNPRAVIAIPAQR